MRKTAPRGWISITEFESLTGINKKTITAAINRGAIPERYADQVGGVAKAPYVVNPQQAAVHWFNDLNPKHASQKKNRKLLEDFIKTFKPEAIKKKTPAKKNTEGKITAENAYEREQIAKAELAELKVLQLKGELVQKARVEEQLFNAGKLLREAIMSVPDKITDHVCAYADDRDKVRQLLNSALSDALREQAEMIIK